MCFMCQEKEALAFNISEEAKGVVKLPGFRTWGGKKRGGLEIGLTGQEKQTFTCNKY